jgi:hypothetical protein
VVSLLSANREHARWFVENILSAVGKGSAKVSELREAVRLRLSFGCGQIAADERPDLAVTPWPIHGRRLS